jgi:hypothetical protein
MASSGPIARALEESLRNAEIPASDRAALALARRYAQLLDEARGRPEEAAVFDTLGARFLAALTALGLTLAGRGKSGGGDRVAPSTGKLDELRARRGRAG